MAAAAVALAAAVGVPCEVIAVRIEPGPNLEERARQARLGALGPAAVLGHTADDRAETVLINLLRGAGAAGLSAMGPGPTRPLLGLRRRETVALCRQQGLTPLDDPSNRDPRFVRNRIRHDVLPLLDDVAGRDVVELLVRTADLLAADLEAQRMALAPWFTDDARVIAALPAALGGRIVREWLIGAGQRPDRAAVERVLAVARGAGRACELAGGVRVERHRQRLRIVPEGRVS